MTAELNTAKSEAFAQRMLLMLNDGSLSLMVSLGHRLGLFDVLADLSSSTSHEIAQAAQLNERWVREWLGAMAAGKIVECDPSGPRFRLPPEHAAVVTRAAGPRNLSSYLQYVPLLGALEDKLLACFRSGGGLPYTEYARFHDVMAEDSAQTTVAMLGGEILPLIPEIIERLEQGIDVLDVGCGRGAALVALAERFPRSRFAGYELDGDAVAHGREAARARGLDNLHFLVVDLTHFDWTETFDFITAFDAIHDQARPDRVLTGISRALRPDGVFLMQEMRASSDVHKNLDRPAGPFLYTVSCLHCMSVSLAEGGLGLGAMWGEELARTMLSQAGFTEVAVHQLPRDFQNSYFVIRK
jgi:SAM-dependent methyltransferase